MVESWILLMHYLLNMICEKMMEAINDLIEKDQNDSAELFYGSNGVVANIVKK